MKLTDTILDGLVVISIDGHLDHANIGILNDLVAAHLNDGNHHLLLDLTACSSIDSAGLSAMMTLLKTIEGEGTLSVAAPSSNVRRPPDIVGRPQTNGFRIYDDVASARSAVAA